MAIPFLNGIDVTGTVDLSNLTIDGAQGTDGQVLTSTGTGIAWEDASGGASLSGGEASKVAIWSATDTLTHHDSFHFNTSNTRLGIGTQFPNYTLDVAGNIGLAQFGYIYFGTNSSNQLLLSNSLSGAQITQAGSGDLELNSASNGILFKAGGTAKAKLLSSGNFGIGDTNPNRTLVVSETRTGSTASDAYTAIVKSVQSSGASPNPGTGGLKVQYTSSSSNVHAFGLVAGSSSSDFLTTGPMHFYTNSDLDTVSATGYAMQLDTSQRLILGSTTATQKLNVDGNVKANRYYGSSSTNYYVDPDDGTASAILNGAVSIGNNSVYTKFTVSTPAGYGDGADGIFIRSSFAGSSPVVSDKDPFLSIGCSDDSGSVSTIFMGEDATATSQETKIEYSHDNNTLSIYKSQMGNYVEHVRFGNISSSGTARTRFYGNVGIGTNPGDKLDVYGTTRLGHSSTQSTRFGAYGTLLSTDTHISHNLYWNSGWQVISSSVPSSSIRLGGTSSNEIQLQFAAAGSTSASTQVYFTSSGVGQAAGSFRAPIFYDSNNTGYYVDPASTSQVNNVTMNGELILDSAGGTTKFIAGGGDAANYTNQNVVLSGWNGLGFYNPTTGGAFTNQTTAFYDFRNGIFSVKGSHRAPIFYDSDNTNFHWNPNTDNSHRFTTPSGYLDIGPKNTSWCHLYTDRNGFYFNKTTFQLNGNQVFHDGYHPNADTLTTARTIGGSSFNGSANIDVNYIKAGGNGPSTENLNTVANSVSTGRLEYRGFNSSSSNRPPVSDNANGVITVGQHSGNYNAQLAFSSNGNIYWRDNPSSSFGSWRKVWDEGNDGSGTGLDADLLDGYHSAQNGANVNLRTASNGYLYINNWIHPSNGAGLFYDAGVHFHETSNYMYSSTSVQAANDMRAPIFYDRDDTARYLDPASTSVMNTITTDRINMKDRGDYITFYGNTSDNHSITSRDNNGSVSDDLRINSYHNVYFNLDSNNNNSTASTGIYVGQHGAGSGAIQNAWTFYSQSDGVTFASGSFRAPIFYDSNNTSYYVNPASNSKLYQLSMFGHSINSGQVMLVPDKTSYSSGGGFTNMTYRKMNSYLSYTPETVVSFQWNTSQKGSIGMNSYGTQFNTSSDYRLKENAVILTDGIQRVKQLQPKRFNFIGFADQTLDGFFAHEVSDIVPEAVTGEKDAVDENNDPVHQVIDQSKIVPLLTAALKEAISKIEDLETRIQILENQ